MSKRSERRLLKLAVALACLVPLGAGTAGVVLGPTGIENDIPRAHLKLDSHFRYLSGLLLGIGMVFAACIPKIERKSELFSALSAIVAIGGLSRLWALAVYDMPAMPHVFALVMELAVVPMLFIWQKRVALASKP
ncbi:MAG: DUF4345 domain-containing protein [Sphingomonas sp.]|nr:DUF4345 domain-containing protein [Sphingomonas sp.]